MGFGGDRRRRLTEPPREALHGALLRARPVPRRPAAERETMSTLRNNRTALLAMLCCVLYLPFLGQAFHIDDMGFIEPARQIGWNPLRVNAPDGLTDGAARPSSLAYGSTHAVLLPYYIKTITAVFGEREAALHASFLPFSVLGLACLGALHARWFPRPGLDTVWPVLLFSVIPAFLVSSHTIMSDVPTLTLLLLFHLVLLRNLETGRPVYAYAAGAVLLCAVFLSYQMLVFVPLGLFLAAISRRMNIHTALGLLSPVLLLCLWLLALYARYGHLPITLQDFSVQGTGIASEIRRGLRPEVFPGKVVNIFATLGSSLLFVYLVRTALTGSFPQALRRLFLAALLSVVPVGLVAPDYSVAEVAALTLLAALGLLIFWEVAAAALAGKDGENRPRTVYLLAWSFTVIGYNILVMPFGAARYLLPALPPLMFLLLDVPAPVPSGGARRTAVVAVAAAAVLFGLASSSADYAYAGVYRDFAGEVKRFRDNRPLSGTTWYIGKWGMQYYLEQAGCRRLPEQSTEPRKGDFIIIPEMPRFSQPAPGVTARMKFYASREYRSPLPLRLFNRRSNAGFYAHHWGLLPFAFSREPDELFQIWEVTS